MFCPNCGAQNNDNSTFCTSCGSVLKKPTAAPPMRESAPPPMRAPMQQGTPMPISVNSKPYISEFVMGLIGSIIGVIIFIIVFIGTFTEFESDFTPTDGLLTLIASLHILTAFILGFVGTGRVYRGLGKGGIPLVIGGGFGFVAAFFGPWGWSAAFFFPLLLAAGIMALARRNSIERR